VKRGLPEPGELPAASSFMSSRWSRDNLVTSHPARLYDGRVAEHIDQETLEYLVDEAPALLGPLRLGPVRRGVLTWDIACESNDGPLLLQLPQALDEPGRRGRARRDVPRLNRENMQYFSTQGLTRYVLRPRELLMLGGRVPAAVFEARPEYLTVGFAQGSLQVELAGANHPSVLRLGPRATAELLAEMIAALAYHYDADLDGGTAVTDVLVNDGDFAVKRAPDGSFELRLCAARRREGGIGPSLFLLYLVQLMTFEDFTVDHGLTGLPVLISNPSVTFEGVVRGLRYRSRDLGRPEQAGVEQARRWIDEFGRSRAGRAYRPWAERFLSGRLPLSFGEDPRERWWRVIPLQKRQSFLELLGRARPASAEAGSARTIASFLERLSREIGRRIPEDPDQIPLNELDRAGLLDLLAEVGVEPELHHELVARILAHWPYRTLDQLLAKVPEARGLRRLKSRLWFGHSVAAADQGTPRSFAPPSKRAEPSRPLANPEVLCPVALPPSLQAAASEAFPTFEAYMDAALHDPTWGYYGHGVVIGASGAHFSTNPELFTPHYGRWIARLAFKAWRELVARGELGESEPFPVVEFGAGNGRLARDFLDGAAALAEGAAKAEADAWRAFTAQLEYRIYETSASLREKQGALLGARARVLDGDARRPAETLSRDFPSGLKGFVVTNEVPDAFGVHKVVLTARGEAFAALVVPRVGAALREALGAESAGRVTATDALVRAKFGFSGNPGEFYLDGATYIRVMAELAELPRGQRDERLAGLWFEEAYVPAACIPALHAHLQVNAAEYATALAAEDSGVVAYVNVHAGRFLGELGSVLTAGFIVTIDYGDTTWGLVNGARRGDFPFRVYGDWQDYVPRPNDPYAAPGTQDMTADVNFTDLARAAADAGLSVIHFGPERDVIGDELPEVLRQAASDETIAQFLGNPVFKVLVVGRRESAVFSGELTTKLALSHGERSVAKERRDRIAAIQAELEGQAQPQVPSP
jgi:SAM-dependent MidA family methyltransferase